MTAAPGRSMATRRYHVRWARTSSPRSLISSPMSWPSSPTTLSIWITTRNGRVPAASPIPRTAYSQYPTRLSVDAIVQSGLRASTPTVPNGIALAVYGAVNLSVVQKIASRTELRLDILNVGDDTYQIRNGTGVGVGAPQYGIRRTILAGLTQRF